ncbi:MAG: D-lyxose/D-mannose family sugar isomerase [Ruminiclostridium sp.]|nr:D-lyxose/D-mannose family sugar isomerase [Ruminiclostridium sp.]
MITREQYEEAQRRSIKYLKRAGIAVTSKEKQKIEVVDFGLGIPEVMGLEILIYVNTIKVCAKELIMFPGQTCAEHIHPTINNISGKEETFRCRWGKVYLYISGPSESNIKAKVPESYKDYFTVFNEIELNPGEQYTLAPDTLHWFQAGPEGAIVSEFSTTNTDEFDRFTNPFISRFTQIEERMG